MAKRTVRLDLALGTMVLVVALILLSLSPLVVPNGENAGHFSVDLLVTVAMFFACLGTFMVAHMREGELRANGELRLLLKERGEPCRVGDMPGDGSVPIMYAASVFLGVVFGAMIHDPGAVVPDASFAATVLMSLINGMVWSVVLVELARVRDVREMIAERRETRSLRHAPHSFST